LPDQGPSTRHETVERGRRKWLIAFGIALAPLLETVDSTIVNVALPSIQGNLGASLDEATSLRARDPVVDIRALRDRSIWSGCLLAAGFGTTLIGLNFILPQYLQEAIAFTPTLSGQYLLFRGIPVVMLAPAIGAALGANAFDPRLLIAFGFFATGVGTGWIGILTTSDSNFGLLVWPLVVAGIGTAFLIIPLLTVVIASVTQEMAPKASAFVTLSIQLGGSISSAAVVTLMDRRQRFHSSNLAGDANLHRLAQSGHVTSSTLFTTIQSQADVMAYADITYVIAALSFVLVPCVFIVRRPPKGKPIEAAAG
jgi:DHA2 family multidrug resistance protein